MPVHVGHLGQRVGAFSVGGGKTGSVAAEEEYQLFENPTPTLSIYCGFETHLFICP